MRKMRLCKPFTCHTSEPPGWSLNVPAFNFPTVSRSIPFLFKLLRTLLCFSRSTLLFSSNSELFTAKHPAWGTHNVPTFTHSDIPALPIRPIAAERFRCHNSQRYGISSRSEETTPLSSVSKTSERTSGTARVGFQGLYLQTSEQNGPLRKKAWVQRSKR